MSRATVYDVAREAGVSIKTVSRVVNGSEAVTPQTRDRVMAAVTALKYVPNSNALSLKSGSSRTVGVVVDSLADPFFAAIVAVVESKLVTAGYTVLVAATNRQGAREREQVIALTRHRIAGLLLVPASSDHTYLADALHGIPLVMVDRDGELPGCDVVRVQDHDAAQEAIAGMLAAGHRRIAFVGDSNALPTNRDRHRGYLDAFAAAGVPVDPELERWDSDQPDAAAGATRALLALPDPPTAFFCCHPRGAAGTIRALHELGRTDCAMISFGDVQLGDLLDPALTVIDHRPEELAEAAVALLLRRMTESATGEVGRDPEQIVLPLQLIRRGSGELTP
ncbi:LacI family DNA-binding transcriptional regulator [Nakamurella lactea]|uniref:LacI family DNA-binding transcriptional regulator n=1 Tax=Nakamurella lactea TaxID=459515 RepID=UPI000683E514|nr:LacI family DNA-binding transcriptional regulator [Nakamurella lactea]